ncbi:putative RNA-directed DNA polymerase [Helianthus annuus]|nr:putative RNA-directed DNA polymerase [Helianthus annuus]
MQPNNNMVNNDLSIQIANFLKTSLNSQNQNPISNLSDSLNISIKLNSQNYPLWARMIRVAIRGKSKTFLNHLSGKPAPPEPDDDKYEQWEQNDLIVFSWLIQNIEPAIASNLTELPTAKSLWDTLVVTYSSGKDNLTGLATTGTPETEGLGFLSRRRFGQTKSYDTSSSRIDKSKLKCNYCGMTKHMKDQCFKLVGFPEWWNDGYKKRKNSVTEGGKSVAAVGNSGINNDNSGATSNNNEPRSEGFGGIASARFGEFGADPTDGGNGFESCFSNPSILNPKFFHPTVLEILDNNSQDSNKCNSDQYLSKTKGNSFINKTQQDYVPYKRGDKIIFEKSKNKKKPLENFGQVNMAKTYENLDESWIFDCGATDTMTFDLTDLVSRSKPKISHIKTANGGKALVEGGGTIEISPTLKLSNCLYVPSLSHKLLSISHVTKELNCTVLMHPTFCILQDIRTGEIIGRGTERQGLYYVEEVTQHGNVMLAHGSTDREAWLWHRRLGHPSTGGQGEKEYIDTLGWLKWTPSPEEINQNTQDEPLTSNQSSEPIVSATNQDPPSPVTNTQDNPSQEANHNTQDESLTSNQSSEPIVSAANQDPPSPVTEEHGETIQEGQATERYVLPPRVNRGIPPKRYSPEKETRPSRYPVTNIANGNLSREAKAFTASLYDEQLPNSVEQALDSENWKDAMEIEMEALLRNKTWEKCVLPPGKKTVGCRWVFTIKHKPDGSIERYKARLVAKGYTQTYGIDYSETFSPVAKIDTIRVLFSIAANEGWPLHQFDVKNAFLHGELKEEVYMEAPPGFTTDFKTREVCRLKKTLYGLKQSPRAWFGRFTLAMKRYGFQQSNSDHTLFLKRRGKLVTCLIIYVDDMIITGNDKEEMENLKTNLFTEFEMKDLGRLKYFLGIEVLRSKHGIFICQKKYILDLLAEIGMIDCKPADTPIMTNQKLYMEEGAELADKERYQRLVAHMDAVWRIIRYLKGTAGHGVLFQPNNHLRIQAYTDADWAGDKGDRKSTSGYFTLVGGNLVTWRSKKQKVVALSSAEAEFRGIARGLAEVLWIRKLLTEIGFPQLEASTIMCDNEAAIQISENPVQHDRTKHVEVDRHFIKEKLEAGILELSSVRSKDQLADILTKAVNARIFSHCLDKLSIGDPTTQLEGEC